MELDFHGQLIGGELEERERDDCIGIEIQSLEATQPLNTIHNWKICSSFK